MAGFIREFRQILDKYGRDEVTVYAAQASFFIILAFFPFIMLLLTLIQFIPTIGKSDLLAILVAIMPDMLDSLVIGIVDDLFVRSPGTIISITGLAALWSAARGMMGIERGLNRICNCMEKRNYLVRRLVCSVYTLVLMLVCIVSLVLLVLGTSIQNMLLRLFPVIGNITRHIISFRSLLAMALFLIFFIGLYTIVPKKDEPLAADTRGHLFSRVLAVVFLSVFAVFQPFQPLLLHVRKPDCHHPDDAVAVFLHLHPLYRCGDQ